MIKRIRAWLGVRRTARLDDIERWRQILNERDGTLNPQGDAENDDIKRWRKLIDERVRPMEKRAQRADAKMKVAYAALILALISGTAGAIVVFRSAIPFGTASSWSSAVQGDPNAVRGPWFNTNEHSLAHTNTGGAGTDWQVDNLSFSVQAFGAKGNGIVDDTAAIQATINACVSQGGIIFFPPGTYKITSSLTVTDKTGIQFIGAGMRSVTITWAGAVGGTMLVINGVRESRFSEFTLIGDVANPSATAITYDGDLANSLVSTKNRFERIFIQNYFAYGIRIGQTAFQADQTQYEQVAIFNASTAAVSIEDANAVLHNFYDCQFQGNAIGITSNLNGTGGSFNLYGCVFKSNTSVDIQTYPGSRGYTFDGVASETGAIFLQMPQASTNTSVTLTECSVNGSTSAGPHIRVGSGSLNIFGGKYTATAGGTFTISVGNLNGNVANVNVVGTTFPDGNPFTGANISTVGGVRKIGLKYANIGSEQGDSYGQCNAEFDTAGNGTTYTGMSAGLVSTVNGKTSGDVTIKAPDGPPGTAGLLSGGGANLFLRSGGPGATGGAGLGTAGNIYLVPGNANGAASIFIADNNGVNRGQWLPNGTSWLFPSDDNARKLGASANRFLGFFVDLVTNRVNANISSASTIAPTNAIVHVTGTATLQTITPPADFATSGNGGSIDMIADGAWSTNTAGNISTAFTATTGNTYRFVYDNGTTKWYIEGADTAVAATAAGTWAPEELGTSAVSTNFIRPYQTVANTPKMRNVACSWTVAGTLGTTGVVAQVVDTSNANTELCSCTLGACTTTALTALVCDCNSAAITAGHAYAFRLKSTSDCSTFPQNVACSVELTQ